MTSLTLSPVALWRRHPREAVVLGALALVGALAAGGAAWSTPSMGDLVRSKPAQTAPAPPPLLIRPLAPTDAAALNGEIPLVAGPNPAAKPFTMAKLDAATRAQALECLTSAIYYEAGNESADGQRAVAQVVLNRVRHPAFPSSVCGVVYQGSTRSTGCQFTFTCDGSLQRRPSVASWTRARGIAEAALNGAVFGTVGLATHYHANYVMPYWAPTLAKNAVIGAHLFYRWAGGWGKPPAFTQRYAKQEPTVAALKSAALAAFAARAVEAAPTEEEVAEIPGAEVEAATPGRIKIRFNLAEARKAVEEAPRERYVEKVAASDNLRWTLSGGAEASDQKPLGSGSDKSNWSPTASN